jgi:hypothetical protein
MDSQQRRSERACQVARLDESAEVADETLYSISQPVLTHC